MTASVECDTTESLRRECRKLILPELGMAGIGMEKDNGNTATGIPVRQSCPSNINECRFSPTQATTLAQVRLEPGDHPVTEINAMFERPVDGPMAGPCGPDRPE